MNNELKTGLWKKQSQKGTNYYSGTIKIDGQEYNIRLFANANKKTDKSPDLQLMMDVKQPKTQQEALNNVIVSDPFKDFANEIEVKSSDLPF